MCNRILAQLPAFLVRRTQTLIVGAFAVGLVPVLNAAAIWESPDWALQSAVDGRVTYDSNVFGGSDGESDTYVSVRPSLTLLRHGSLTKFSVDAALTIRRFDEFTDEDSEDPHVTISYGFPDDENELPRYEAQFEWEQASEVDPDIVERVRSDRLLFKGNGELYNTGKTTLDGTVSASRWNVDAWDAESRDFGAGLAIGMQRHELLKYSLGYSYSRQDYDTTGTVADSDLTENEIYVSARGALFAKLTGSVNFGVTRSDAGGAVVYDSTDWTAGMQLDWEATARRRVALRMTRGTWFAVDGGLLGVTALTASLNQTIGSGFTAILRGSFRDVDRQTGGLNDYQGYGLGMTLRYGLTGKLTAELSAEYYDFDYESPVFDYSRHVISLGAVYAF